MYLRVMQGIAALAALAFPVGWDLSHAEDPDRERSKGSSTQNSSRFYPSDCWAMRSLGTLGGESSSAVDLNDSGQVVGTAATEPRVLDPADPPISLLKPFISGRNGGSLIEIAVPGYFGGDATAINNAGQVVGTTTIGRSFPVAYVTDPGGRNARATLAYAVARDINDAGQTLWDISYPFFKSVIGPNEQPQYSGTNLIDVAVPTPDPYQLFTESAALNDDGEVAVHANQLIPDPQDAMSPSPETAYRWSDGSGAHRIAPDATSSRVSDMNDAGQTVGVIRVGNLGKPTLEQAFITRRYIGSLVLLGAPGDGNMPTGINNLGQIVGTRGTNGETQAYATAPMFVNRDINLSTLNEVIRDGWTEVKPQAINNRGQIAGTGKINGAARAFLLSPLSPLALVPDRNGQHAVCYRWGGDKS